MNGRILDKATAEGQISAAFLTAMDQWKLRPLPSDLDYADIEEKIGPVIERAILFALLKQHHVTMAYAEREALTKRFDWLTAHIEADPFWRVVREPRELPVAPTEFKRLKS